MSDDRILRRFRAHAERIEDERKLAQILIETGEAAPAQAGATAPGDTRKLRGIPAIGRGVTGACKDTVPHQQRSHSNAIT